ncbi:MAG: hypothetical protein ABSH08_12470 [Tepidisphaeraceae bacterium]|jgi:hypothetical protein
MPTLSNPAMECCRITPAEHPANMPEMCRRLEIVRHTLVGESSSVLSSKLA